MGSPIPFVIPAVCLASGCSLIYPADDLRGRQDAAPADAIPIDAGIADVDPGGLELAAVEPSQVFEGTGSGGSRPAVVLVDGTNIAGDAVLTAAFVDDAGDDAGVGEAVPVVEAVVASTFDRVALTLEIPVLTDLDRGALRTLRITATQADGSVVDHIDVDVVGLDELEPTVGPLLANTLDPLYSRAVFASGIYIGGTAPPRIRVTSDITISATVDVSAYGAAAGPGACLGGGANQSGQCAPGGGGGGGALLSSPGGGGGGFGVTGISGTGTGAGGGGGETGDPMLTPLGESGNRGNGGGGGGGLLDLPGGPGGAGGGALEVTAGGRIVVETGGRILSAGGAGGTGLGGGGGGGSGGALVVRAAGGVETDHPWLEAPGGGATARGGPGAVGRIRVDVPTATVGEMATLPDAVAGPMWATDAPVIVRSTPVSLELAGDPLRTYGVRIDDGSTDSAQGGSTVVAELEPGLNEICALVSEGIAVTTPESRNCITVVLVP